MACSRMNFTTTFTHIITLRLFCVMRAAQCSPLFQFAVSWGTRFLVQWLQLGLTYLSYYKEVLGMFSFSKQTRHI